MGVGMHMNDSDRENNVGFEASKSNFLYCKVTDQKIKKVLKKKQMPAAIKPEMGMVKIHAQMIVPATPQRTADSRLVAPTPIIAPVIVWVVLTGIPATDAPMIEIAAAVSAQKPPIG